jgi:hypothetical protein
VAFSIADVIAAAQSRIGRPYAWGATGPDSFDCSGLMVWAYKKAGVSLPRTSQAQATYGTAVKAADIRPGDLVTSDWGLGPSSHVAMYIGGGKLIHAPGTGQKVKVANFDATYRSKVNAIRRVPGGRLDGAEDAGFDLPDLGDILPDFGEGLADSLLGPVRAVGEQLAGMAASLLHVGKFAEFLLKLALPSTWVRIVCGLLGGAVLLLGLGFLIREARSV